MFAPSQGVINPEQPNQNMMKSFYLLFTSFIIGFACVAQVPSYVPEDGLVAWIPLDDANTFYSEQGAIDIQETYEALPAPDRFGVPNGAHLFDGNDDFIALDSENQAFDFSGQQAISISVWVKPNSSGPQFGLLGYSPFSGVYPQYALKISGDSDAITSGYMYFISGVSLFESNGFNLGPTPLNLGEWSHLVMTYDGSVLKFFLNGQLEFQNVISAMFPDELEDSRLFLGKAWGAANTSLDGSLDDVGLWSRALHLEEIQSLDQGIENTSISGCMDETACNYNSQATEDNGNCIVVNASNTVTACFGTSVSIDLGINPSVSDSEVTDNTPAQINLPIRVGNYSGEVAGFVLKSDLGPSSWSSIVHVTQSPMLTEAGKWWMPQLTELEDTCWISASNYAWNPFDKVQLIQFPVLDTLEVNSNYSVDAWDGLSGGLMVLAAQEQVIVNATLDMRGRGFRGFTHDSRVNSQDGVQGESWAGEGISSFDPNESGGGGGDGGPPGCQDGSGGGGGSSLSAGGIGLGDCGFPSNPGIPFASPTSTILLGSAGGEGGADEDGGRPGGGGNGGGAVLILCDNVQGAGLIDVGGNNGGSACQGCFGGGGSGMGGGGGGAGGSVVTPVTLEVTTNLLGGSGGPNAQCGGCTTRYGGAGSEGYVQNIDFSWTSQGLSIAWEDGQAGGIWQSSEFVANDTISYVILANDLEVCQGEIALVGISGCNDTSACNYSETDICNNACVYPLIDNDCNAGAVACSEGTVWDSSTQTCVVANLPYLNEPGEIAELNPCYFDTNFNGLVDVTDLMNILSVFGATCAYEE